jgi:hypothetical protein
MVTQNLRGKGYREGPGFLNIIGRHIIDLMWHGRVTGRPDAPHLKFLRIKEMARLLILLVSFGFYARVLSQHFLERNSFGGVRGTLTKFKRRRGVAKSVNVPRFKICQRLSIPHPHAKFHHRGVLGLAEAQEQRGRARVMFRDGIQILVERRF